MAWYNGSWSYRISVTIDADQIDSNLSNFPVYVNLADLPAGFHTNVKSDGGDIRVTTSDETTEVAREVVFYDSTTDTGELWFKATSVSSSTDTVFYIYYGNASASDYARDATYGLENVWTESFEAVYHFQDDLTDSTSNGYDLTANGTLTYTTGKIGKALVVDADADFADITDANSPNIDATPDLTVGGFVYPTDTSKYNSVSNKTTSSNRAMELFIDGGSQNFFFTQTVGGSLEEVKTTTAYGSSNLSASANTWYRHMAKDDGTTMTITVDDERWTNNVGTGTRSNPANNYEIGRMAGWPLPSRAYFDEVRYSSTHRSNAWDDAEYVNQTATTTFYTVGTQEEGSTVVSATTLTITSSLQNPIVPQSVLFVATELGITSELQDPAISMDIIVKPEVFSLTTTIPPVSNPLLDTPKKWEYDALLDEVLYHTHEWHTSVLDLRSNDDNKGAELVGIHDAGDYYDAGTVEGALQEAESKFVNVTGDTMTGTLNMDGDAVKTTYGDGQDMEIFYDGTDAKIVTDKVAASDLVVDCGTGKTLKLAEAVWDDLRTPINSSIKVSGKAPTETVYRGGIVYSFSKVSDNTIAFNVQLPHEYKLGSDIEFHIHYLIPTAGAGAGAENVKWDFTYSWAGIGDAQPSETTVNTTLDMQNKSADTHYLGEIAETIDGSGISGVSSMLICSLNRDVSVADNYDDVVYLIEVDFHYQIDTMGSRLETTK